MTGNVICIPRIVDYRVPLEEKRFKDFITNWMNLHTTDHSSFFLALNSLREALGEPQIKFHRLQLFFNPENLTSVNQFLYYNSIEHKEIYNQINKLGELATPTFYVLPVFNIMERFTDLHFKTFGEFIFHENRVHTLVARAINLLYDALGVS